VFDAMTKLYRSLRTRVFVLFTTVHIWKGKQQHQRLISLWNRQFWNKV